MNVERLHAIVLAVSEDLKASGSVATMLELRDALSNQVSSPQEPSHSEQTGTAYETLQTALTGAPSNQFPPTWTEVIEELGFEGLLGVALRDEVQSILSSNQVTLSLAAEQISAIAARLEQLDEGLDQLLAGFVQFEIGSEELGPGEAEVGVLIPRAAIDGGLQGLGQEFVELERRLAPFTELATGSRAPLSVATISSSDFGVFVEMLPEAAALVAVAVNRVIATYKGLLDIRIAREQLHERGLSDEQLATIDEEIATRMDDSIGVVVDELVDGRSSVSDDGRNNELRIELRFSLNSLANRIDRGYSIDVRANEPDTDDDEPATDAADGPSPFRVIMEASDGLRYVNRTGQPILQLSEGDNSAVDDDTPEDDEEDQAGTS